MDLNFFKNKRILITGGAGFIGSNLCEFFIKSNSIVRCLDNFSNGKIDNIITLFDNKNFEFIDGDICDINVCLNSSKNIDYVLHNAAVGSVTRSINDPLTTNNSNINGFLNMLEASKINKVKRFIYASSSSVYGDSKDLPKKENNIGNPLSPYAITKLTNELYASNFSNLYDFETIGLRYFNVFGPNQDPNGDYAAVVPKFIIKLINSESPNINGDGSYSRDFTFIENVIKMNSLAIMTEDKSAINQVFNVACGYKTTILELFNIIKDILLEHKLSISGITPVFNNIRTGDIPHSLASIEKSEKLLGYNPAYNIVDGLNLTIKWYLNNYKK